MRRKDREVTRHGDLMEMVARFKVCRLGLWDGREVYVVPLNFGYEEKNGSLSLFFHCAREGRKLDILQNRPEVSFEMDGDHVLLEGDVPCRYSYAYGSRMEHLFLYGGKVPFALPNTARPYLMITARLAFWLFS